MAMKHYDRTLLNIFHEQKDTFVGQRQKGLRKQFMAFRVEMLLRLTATLSTDKRTYHFGDSVCATVLKILKNCGASEDHKQNSKL